MDALLPGSQTVIMRSTDGGVTWREAGRVDGGGDVISTAGPGRVIVTIWEANSSVLAYFPGLERLTPPLPSVWPLSSVVGRIVWSSSETGRSGWEINCFAISEIRTTCWLPSRSQEWQNQGSASRWQHQTAPNTTPSICLVASSVPCDTNMIASLFRASTWGTAF